MSLVVRSAASKNIHQQHHSFVSYPLGCRSINDCGKIIKISILISRFAVHSARREVNVELIKIFIHFRRLTHCSKNLNT